MKVMFNRSSWMFGALCAAVAISGCTRTAFDAVRMNQRAQVYIRHGDYQAASTILQESLDADFQNSASHYWLGKCHAAQTDIDKAIYEYELAVRFNPSMEIAQLALIKTLELDGQTEQSVLAAKKWIKHKDAVMRDYTRLAELLMADGLETQAIEIYLAAAEKYPQDARPLLATADYYFAKNDEQQGINYLVRAFKAEPLYPGLARRLGTKGLQVEIPRAEPPKKPSQAETELRDLEL